MIPGFIEQPFPEAPSDHIGADSPPLQIRNSSGSAPSGPGEGKGFLFLFFLCTVCLRRTPACRHLLDFAADQRMNRIHQPIAPNLDQIIQGVNAAAPAVPIPVSFSGHINQAVMLFMPVIRPVPFEHSRLIGLQIGEQIRLPRRLNLFFGYAGHRAGTVFLFIVPRLLSVMKKDAQRRLTAVQVMVDLGTVITVHCCRGIIQRRQQVCLDIPDFCSVLVNTVKDILQVAGIDLQETALYHLPGKIIPGDTDKGAFG